MKATKNGRQTLRRISLEAAADKLANLIEEKHLAGLSEDAINSVDEALHKEATKVSSPSATPRVRRTLPPPKVLHRRREGLYA